jgi:aryl-alcohol dehydrogenase-like predicted oxidoreductase
MGMTISEVAREAAAREAAARETFSVGEVATAVGLTTYTLRWYEQEGLVIQGASGMRQRIIGTNGPSVGVVGLGCMGMSFAYGQRDDEQSAHTLLRALDLGVTHLDTADLYGWGHNEELIGRTLRGRRDEFILATKFANRFDPATERRWLDSSGAWARQACDASLVTDGKVRWLGLSEVSPETLRRAHAVHPINAVQIEYSLFTRFVEDEMLATCRELGVALVAYSPVGRGWLTGAVTSIDQLTPGDSRRDHPRFTEEAFAANLALVEEVRKVAAEIGCTPAQAALAWLLAQGEDVLPIPGTKRVAYLEENAAAAAVVLSDEQRAQLPGALTPLLRPELVKGALGRQDERGLRRGVDLVAVARGPPGDRWETSLEAARLRVLLAEVAGQVVGAGRAGLNTGTSEEGTASAVDEPGDIKIDVVSFEEWHDDIPTTTSRPARSCSSTACPRLTPGRCRPGDPAHVVGGTGTLREHRGRGLAKLAKSMAGRKAAEAGITAAYTCNDEVNRPMLAITEWLGYRSCATQWSFINTV